MVHRYFKAKKLAKGFDQQRDERQPNAQRTFWIGRRRYITGSHVCRPDLKDKWLERFILDSA